MSTPAPPEHLTAFAAEELRRADVASVSFAAFGVEGVRWAGALGWADTSRAEPATPATRYRAASMSKPVTAAAALALVDAGRLGLDDEVNDIVGEAGRVTDAAGKPAAVTVRHLLTHTSGLASSTRGVDLGNRLFSFVANEGGRVAEDLEASVAGLKLKYPPGERIVYANGGYSLLGHVIALAGGDTFEAVATGHVLEPLSMSATEYAPELHGVGVATPYGHPILGPRREAGTLRMVATPMGGLWTTAGDMARFGRMVLRRGELDGSRVLPPELVDAATTMAVRNHPDLDEGFGLGFVCRTWRGRRVAFHDGGMPGVSTKIALAIDDGVGVVVLTNGADPCLQNRISFRALEAVLGLEPEAAPGSPEGVRDGDESAWEALAKRASGKWAFVDYAPAFVMEPLMNLTSGPVAQHVAGGRLVLRSRLFGSEPVAMAPDGEVGRFRMAYPNWSGTRAVVVEQDDALHLWFAAGPHLVRRG